MVKRPQQAANPPDGARISARREGGGEDETVVTLQECGVMLMRLLNLTRLLNITTLGSHKKQITDKKKIDRESSTESDVARDTQTGDNFQKSASY